MGRHVFKAVEESFKGGEARNNLFIRLVETLRKLLQQGGVTLDALAAHLEMDARSVRRYLAGFREARVILKEWTDEDGHKRFSVDKDDPFVKLVAALDPMVYLSLHFAVSQSSAVRLAGGVSDLHNEVMSIVEKSLGPKHRRLLKALVACVLPNMMGAYKSSPKGEAMKKLLNAMTEGLICSVKYKAARDGGEVVKTQEIAPLWMRPHEAGLYVFHFSYEKNEYTTLNFSRIVSVTVTDRKGELPPGIDPREIDKYSFGGFVGGPLYKYRFRFNAQMAVFARERFWHPTEKFRELKGGGLELTFIAYKTPELITFATRFRSGTAVCEPTWLRDELHDLGEFYFVHQYPTRSEPRVGPPMVAISTGRNKVGGGEWKPAPNYGPPRTPK